MQLCKWNLHNLLYGHWPWDQEMPDWVQQLVKLWQQDIDYLLNNAWHSTSSVRWLGHNSLIS